MAKGTQKLFYLGAKLQLKTATYLDRSSHWLAACTPSCSCTRSYPLCFDTHDHTPHCSDGTHQCLWTENPNEEWIIQVSHCSWGGKGEGAVRHSFLSLGHNWRKLRTRPWITFFVSTLWPIYAPESILNKTDLQMECLPPDKMWTLWLCQKLYNTSSTRWFNQVGGDLC